MAAVEKASGARPLYIERKLLNAEEVIAWAASQGFERTLLPDDMHVTIAFSRRPVLWDEISMSGMHYGQLLVQGGARTVEPLGPSGAVVLMFDAPDLVQEWASTRRVGASWDWPSFKPHVTITYTGPMPEGVEPFTGPLLFGPWQMRDIEPNASDKFVEMEVPKMAEGEGGLAARLMAKLFSGGALPSDGEVRKALAEVGGAGDAPGDVTLSGVIVKRDDPERMIYGWASVVTKGGKAVVDVQGDIIPPAVMEKAATDFMRSARIAKAMHEGEGVGQVIHSFPLTETIKKAFGIQCDVEGWLIGMHVSDPATWDRVVKGELRSFSIGGVGHYRENGNAA